ncbi:hypothetical protein VA596_05325 [Amycolatopsis sp., V23-08]|uniref:DUF2207 domain-containing protein n=1 Tax=Amycolatopsis heterodermiae TaxID=3110235 RepID=A0ABU5QYD9_9PSEU|nr:hypothetical protein [Amycolatopsis sp., V23-08]MEA5358947.1 hypothetical protein [Amycolatopsis sp., V23-08]
MTTMSPPAERAHLLRLGELRFRVFSGAAVVQISPEQWGLHAHEVRQTALGRRYRETPPEQAGFLRFEFAPGFFPPHFDRGPGTAAARRRLDRLLTGQDQFWASLRRLELARADVGAAAATAGMTVVAEASDPGDRLVLLRRAGLPDEQLRPRTAQRITHHRVQYWLFTVFAASLVAAGAWALFERTTAPLLLTAGATTVLVVLRVVAGRSPRLQWLDAPFTGERQVAVPFPPSLSAELLGEVASLYGYFYGGPYIAGRNDESSLFVKCRPGLVFGTPAPALPPAAEPVVEAPGRERWLRNHLDGRDELWLSVRHAKLPPARIAEIAGGEGLLPAGECADPTDRLLLLRRDPAAPPRASGFRMSFAGFLAPVAWLVLCAGGSGVTAAVTGDTRPFTIGFALVVAGVWPMAWVLRVFPRSTRVGWLANEFTGKDSVTFFSEPFGVSSELVRQVAASRGYVFSSQTATRAQGTLVTYVRYR